MSPSNAAERRATDIIIHQRSQQIDCLDENDERPAEEEQNNSHDHGKGGALVSIGWFKRIFYLCVFVFILFPLLSLFLATIFGGLLAWADGTTFLDGFLYVVSNLLGMTNALTEWEPTSGLGVVVAIDIYTAVAALISFGIMLNVVNLFRVPHMINDLIRKFVTRNEFLVPTIALGIIIPAWYAGLCSVMGAILAFAENWHISQGILYVLENILGLADPLTDNSPVTPGGKVIDVVISSIALGYIAIFADYVTTLNPSSYVRFKIRRYLIALGVEDAEQTTVAHPLRQLSLAHVGGDVDAVDKDDEEEGDVETTNVKSLLVGSFLPDDNR